MNSFFLRKMIENVEGKIKIDGTKVRDWYQLFNYAGLINKENLQTLGLNDEEIQRFLKLENKRYSQENLSEAREMRNLISKIRENAANVIEIVDDQGNPQNSVCAKFAGRKGTLESAIKRG